MPKGPRVHPDIERYIVELVTDNPLIQSRQIENQLIKEFAGKSISIPAMRTIQVRAKQIVDHLTIQEKPWSLAMMAKGDTDIPWEAAGFLLWAFAELERLKNNGKIIWPSSEHPLDDFLKGSVKEVTESFESGREPEKVSVKPLAPRAPVGTILTNRQAKWLARLHLMFPLLKPNDLFWYVDAYSERELLADYLGYDFDTSDLDGSLRNVLRNIKDREASANTGADN